MTASPRRRVAAIATLAFLTAVPFTFAASHDARVAAPTPRHAVAPKPATLVVPDVLGQPYVFAKGALEDAGLAWYVARGKGFAANTVVAQSPAPGTKLVDTGAPLVQLRLERNRTYTQRGKPDEKAPYHGTSVRLAAS
jgi:PASTA domain-containing protein